MLGVTYDKYYAVANKISEVVAKFGEMAVVNIYKLPVTAWK